MRVPHSWLTEYLQTDMAVDELAHRLTMGGLEVEQIHDWTSEDGEATDQVLVTSVTSNRGDLLSMVGVARHAAAIVGCEWRLPDVSRAEAADANVGAPMVEQGDVKIEVLDFEACPRYSALVIKDIEIGPSPDWMRYRLEAAGIRPICNVVDATNYVCWELGQPMHAFDLRLVARNHIIVRKAGQGEKILLIDDSSVTLTENDLVIADEMGAAALAGVMGGLDTEVRERTSAILLESAHFDPSTIRRTSQRHGVSSESSYRFERNVDTDLTLKALARATDLIGQTAGGQPDGVAIDVRQTHAEPLRVSMRPSRCNALLGTDLTAEQMADYLTRLDMDVQQQGDALQVCVPTFRPDIEREVDLIEEVAIVHGYNNIPATVPGRLLESGLLNPRQKTERHTREVLRQCGLNETIGFSFMSMADLDRCGFPPDAQERKALELLLPVAADMSHLKTTLLPGLLQACAVNVRQRVLDVALFELNRVFIPAGEGELPRESMRVAGIAMGAQLTSSWNVPSESSQADFYRLKGVVEQLCDALNVQGVEFVRSEHSAMHPGRCAQLRLDGVTTGYLGEIAASVQDAYDLPSKTYAFEIDWELLAQKASPYREYDPLPRFPAAARDIALVAADDDAHSSAALMQAIREAGGQYLWKTATFDLYTDEQRLGPGKRSVAFHLTFRAPDRTLTDVELDEAMSRIAEHLSSQLGAEVRDS